MQRPQVVIPPRRDLPQSPVGYSATSAFPHPGPHTCDEHEEPRDSHRLGGDDPLWPYYVLEAERWDDITMTKWNNSMDQLLLFATLFSAILTAFLIETSQNLQPDTSAITASVLIEIAGTLRSLSNGEVPHQNATTTVHSLEDFQPSPEALLVNLSWFLSLGLSIMVALIASLVKQWCNSFLADRIAPPCNQARIRQARLNKLVSWRTDLIVSALPVIMHIALGLFLFGLNVFLRDLNRIIHIGVLIITAATGLFYVGTTILPCFIPFCPYETPLSSLRVWGYFYQLCYTVGLYIYGTLTLTRKNYKIDFTSHISPCEQQELMTSNNTNPDDVTGCALSWIITHSQTSKPREKAIRSISGLESPTALQQLVVGSPGIFPQVVQGFTSCFRVTTRPQDGERHLSIKKDMKAEHVFQHVQSLVVLVNIIILKRTDDNVDPEYLAQWGVDKNTIEAVEERLDTLARDSECKHKRGFGLIGLSTWQEFVGIDGEARFNRGHHVLRLSQNLDWTLPPDICSGILDALLVESAYWAPDISSGNRSEILRLLVKLLGHSTIDRRPEYQPKLAYALVVLTLRLNRGTTHLRLPSAPGPTDIELGLSPGPIVSMMKYFTKYPLAISAYKQPLLLLALVGLMEHLEHCNFDDENQENIKIIADQLSGLTVLGKPQAIVLPVESLLNVDIRVYLAEVLGLFLRQAHTSPYIESTLKYLLRALHDKRGFWVDHGSLLALPVLQTLSRALLSQSADADLQSLCLSASVQNLRLVPSLPYIKMLFTFDIPYQLILLIKDNPKSRPLLRANATLTFQYIADYMRGLETDQQNSPPFSEIEQATKGLLRRVIENDMLETFVTQILNPHAVVVRAPFWGDNLFEAMTEIRFTPTKLKLGGILQYLFNSGLAPPQAPEDCLHSLFQAIGEANRMRYAWDQWRAFHIGKRGTSQRYKDGVDNPST